jgi:CubicO group peptidase (beta-lactamase class C family)
VGALLAQFSAPPQGAGRVRQLLSHQAGRARSTERPELADLLDLDRVAEVIAAQSRHGTRAAATATTASRFGWYEGELIRA